MPPACRGGICCAPFGCPKFTGLQLPSLCRIEATAAPLTIARPVCRFALAGFGSSGSGNGSNVRTMRTKPAGRWVIGIIVSKARPAYRVCEGIGILSAEGNAATVARHGDGMGREGDGHGI
jgi:hypothetical protein